MNKEPWLLPYTPWSTRADFFNFIRGGIRKSVWSRHPVKLEYMKSVRFKAPIGQKGKEVWAYRCEICGEVFRQNEVEVDHITPAGSLRGEDDLHGFITRIAFVDFDDLRILDKECHRSVSYQMRHNITFEEAVTERKAIAFCKLPIEKQKNFLLNHGVKPLPSNAKARREAYKQLILNGTIG